MWTERKKPSIRLALVGLGVAVGLLAAPREAFGQG